MNNQSLAQHKTQLRAYYRHTRHHVDLYEESIIRAFNAILPHPPAIVGLYCEYGTEFPILWLEGYLRERGYTLALPDPDQPQMLLWEPNTPLIGEGHNRHPQSTTVATPDILFVPGLAFDYEGERLGQGSGYYDRLITSLPHVMRIGCAYTHQIRRDPLPTEDHDRSMHQVITEIGMM